MDVSMWMALQSTMQDDGGRRSVSRATLRRVVAFARPHRRALVAFLGLSTAGAVLGVATPVLAGRAAGPSGRRSRSTASSPAATQAASSPAATQAASSPAAEPAPSSPWPS